MIPRRLADAMHRGSAALGRRRARSPLVVLGMLALGAGGCAASDASTPRSAASAADVEDRGGAASTPSTSAAEHIGGEATFTTHATHTTHTPSPPERRARDRTRCDDGDLAGCHAAALDAFYRPRDPDTDADAVRYFTRGCERGYAPSCNGLGVLYAEGRGVPRDDARAAQLYRGACEAGASTACQHLAAALRDGRGVHADAAAAERADARSACAFEASLGRGALEACPGL